MVLISVAYASPEGVVTVGGGPPLLVEQQLTPPCPRAQDLRVVPYAAVPIQRMLPSARSRLQTQVCRY